MANSIVFAKWDSTPEALEVPVFIETKYYDLGTSSNKVVLLKFVINVIADASSYAFISVDYRTDIKSDYAPFAS